MSTNQPEWFTTQNLPQTALTCAQTVPQSTSSRSRGYPTSLRCSECKGLIYIFIIVVILIFIHWIYIRQKYGDKAIWYDTLNVKVVDFPILENCCSWWPLSHFFLFFFLGMLYPKCDIPILTAGIIWELFEVVMGAATAKERQPIRDEIKNNVEYSDNWWAGSMKDIVMNFAGFYTGKMVGLVIRG